MKLTYDDLKKKKKRTALACRGAGNGRGQEGDCNALFLDVGAGYMGADPVFKRIKLKSYDVCTFKDVCLLR